jgi:hypothetical protein
MGDEINPECRTQRRDEKYKRFIYKPKQIA